MYKPERGRRTVKSEPLANAAVSAKAASASSIRPKMLSALALLNINPPVFSAAMASSNSTKASLGLPPSRISAPRLPLTFGTAEGISLLVMTRASLRRNAWRCM